MYAGLARFADSDLPAAHDNLECFVGAGNDFVRAAERWVKGAVYGVLPWNYMGRILEVPMDECDRG
jgi:hypothetical protein